MTHDRSQQDALVAEVIKAARDMMGGIYEIVNTVNGRRYVGSSVNLRARFIDHRKKLRKHRHSNPPLQAAWNKYGEGAFQFRVLAILEDCELLVTEQRLLNSAFKDECPYNVAIDVTSGMKGREHSSEARAKMSVGVSEYFSSPEAHDRHSQLKAKHGADPVVRAKMSASQKRRFASADVRQAESERQRIHITDQFRQGQSEREKAYQLAHPEKTKQQAASLRAFYANPENRKKLSERMKRHYADKRAEQPE